MKEIKSTQAPGAIGPYSQAIETKNLIFVSGQLPINAETGAFAGDDIQSQTKQSLMNVKFILEAAGCSMNQVCKTKVLLANIEDFAVMNEVYATFFSDPFPARAAFEAANLPKGALVEIEVIAEKL